MADEYSNKDVMNIMLEIRDRVTRIEEGQKRVEKVEDKVEKIDEKVEAIDKRATEALLVAKDAQREVEGLRVSNRWAWGTAITIFVALGGFLLHFL